VNNDVVEIVIGTLQGLGASTVFVLALFIGFCVIFGFTKTKRTAGGTAVVVKSLDERISHQPMTYLPPSAPRGPADQLHTPELLEAAARK
jgi:acid phosphatase family membrane protein YuiD